jgi:hypothetical protein
MWLLGIPTDAPHRAAVLKPKPQNIQNDPTVPVMLNPVEVPPKPVGANLRSICAELGSKLQDTARTFTDRDTYARRGTPCAELSKELCNAQCEGDVVKIFTDEHKAVWHCQALDEADELWKLFSEIWEALSPEGRCAMLKISSSGHGHPFWGKTLFHLFLSSNSVRARIGVQIMEDMRLELQGMWKKQEINFSYLWSNGFASENSTVRGRCLQLWNSLPLDVKIAIFGHDVDEPFLDAVLFPENDPTGEIRKIGTSILLDVWPHINQNFIKSLCETGYRGRCTPWQR